MILQASTLHFFNQLQAGSCRHKDSADDSPTTTALAELAQLLRGPQACLQRPWARTTHPARRRSQRAQRADRVPSAAHHLCKYEPHEPLLGVHETGHLQICNAGSL